MQSFFTTFHFNYGVMRLLFTTILSFCFVAVNAQPKPKTIFECTVEFSALKNDSKNSDTLSQTAMVVYIRNNLSRVDYINQSFIQKKIYDTKRNAGVILQELGTVKVMRNVDSLKWLELNRRYEDASISYSNESKTILGYECKRATIVLRDSSKFDVYYAPQIIPSTTAYEFQFRNIPGFVLEYETIATGSAERISYRATKLNLSPVPVSRFEIPKDGYRVIN